MWPSLLLQKSSNFIWSDDSRMARSRKGTPFFLCQTQANWACPKKQPINKDIPPNICILNVLVVTEIGGGPFSLAIWSFSSQDLDLGEPRANVQCLRPSHKPGRSNRWNRASAISGAEYLRWSQKKNKTHWPFICCFSYPSRRNKQGSDIRNGRMWCRQLNVCFKFEEPS